MLLLVKADETFGVDSTGGAVEGLGFGVFDVFSFFRFWAPLLRGPQRSDEAVLQEAVEISGPKDPTASLATRHLKHGANIIPGWDARTLRPR